MEELKGVPRNVYFESLVNCVGFSDKSNTIFVCCQDGLMRHYNPHTLNVTYEHTVSYDGSKYNEQDGIGISNAAYCSATDIVAVVFACPYIDGVDQFIMLYDTIKGNLCQKLKLPYYSIMAISFSGNGKYIIINTAKGDVYFYDITKAPDPKGLSCIKDAYSVSLSSNGKYSAIVYIRGILSILDTESAEEVAKIDLGKSAIISTVFSDDDKYLICGGLGRPLFVLETTTYGNVHCILQEYTYSIAYNSKRDILAGGGRDGKTYFWCLASGSIIHTVNAPERPPNVCLEYKTSSIAFDSTGQMAVCGINNNLIQVVSI